MAAAVMPPALFQQAQALYRRGDLTEAGKLCQELLVSQPTHFDALHLLGVIASQTGQMSEAIALLGNAIGARPGSAEAYNSLGNVLAQLGRPEQALLSYAQAITLRADFAEAHANHSDMLRQLPQPTDGINAAAINYYAPGAVAPPPIWGRWRSRDHCRLCTTAAFECVDPCDEPAMDISHDARDSSAQDSEF